MSRVKNNSLRIINCRCCLRASNKTLLAHHAAGKNRQPQSLAQFPLQLNFLSNTASPQIMNMPKKCLRCAIKKFFYSYSLSSRVETFTRITDGSRQIPQPA